MNYKEDKWFTRRLAPSAALYLRPIETIKYTAPSLALTGAKSKSTGEKIMTPLLTGSNLLNTAHGVALTRTLSAVKSGLAPSAVGIPR
jgi:hypothetical protein